MDTSNNWFRSLRPRTPIIPSPSVETKSSFDRSDTSPPEASRTKDSAKSASFLDSSLQRHRHDTENVLPKEPHDTWHNPSMEQLVDTLQVVMMSRSTFDTIPVRYNATVLEVLEGYGKQKAEYLDHKEQHNILVEDIRRERQAWSDQESGYEREIKRLEVIIASGKVGLEHVTLARSTSTLERKASKDREQVTRSEPGVSSLRNPDCDWTNNEAAKIATLDDRDVNMSSQLISDQKRNADRRAAFRFRKRRPILTPTMEEKIPTHSKASNRDDKLSSQTDKPNPKRLQPKAELETSSDNESTSSDENDLELRPLDEQHQENQLKYPKTLTTRGHLRNALPSLPEPTRQDSAGVSVIGTQDNVSTIITGRASTRSNNNRGYSFAPGDDTFDLGMYGQQFRQQSQPNWLSTTAGGRMSCELQDDLKGGLGLQPSTAIHHRSNQRIPPNDRHQGQRLSEPQALQRQPNHFEKSCTSRRHQSGSSG